MGDRGGFRQGWRRLSRTESGLAPPTVAERVTERSEAEAPSPAPRRPAARTLGAFMGAGARFEGNLSLKGDFYVDSEFEGELETDGGITVGPNGSIVGQIRAREVVIQGAVHGNVIAPRLLCLAAGAKLHGDIETACLEIERNAFFQGRTTMLRPQDGRAPEIGADEPPRAGVPHASA
ncbi:MAG: polymer-forming cytoskeletal protein [Spirochaetaceae bacterium]|nr:polymer-forming cytoskeletal protein [Myxococcales bacterium]MCB9723082.1 polymer-forming cytoskeletal protein [Spirochaetaceae bacterium]